MKYETIIIGAGPAGLQLGYFLKKGGYEYIILEKNSIAGSFFDSYPHSGKLISINKRHTGTDDSEFNLRHDWNSLLSDEEGLLFKEYSSDYYPSKTDLVKYLNDYARLNDLKILYDSNVTKITKNEDGYTVQLRDCTYNCKKLVCATGLSKPYIPPEVSDVKDKVLHYSEYEKDFFMSNENLEQL